MLLSTERREVIRCRPGESGEWGQGGRMLCDVALSGRGSTVCDSWGMGARMDWAGLGAVGAELSLEGPGPARAVSH